jgi:hypothetical protein
MTNHQIFIQQMAWSATHVALYLFVHQRVIILSTAWHCVYICKTFFYMQSAASNYSAQMKSCGISFFPFSPSLTNHLPFIMRRLLFNFMSLCVLCMCEHCCHLKRVREWDGKKETLLRMEFPFMFMVSIKCTHTPYVQQFVLNRNTWNLLQ